MGKLRTYLVSFCPAKRSERGYYQVSITVGIGAKATEVEAGDFPTLEREVRRLAAEYVAEGKHSACSPYIRLKARGERSAPGFERWSRTLNIIDAIAAEMNAESVP